MLVVETIANAKAIASARAFLPEYMVASRIVALAQRTNGDKQPSLCTH